MSPLTLFIVVIAYFILLLTVAYFTSRGSNNESFFIGNRNSNWMLVAFGMIGTSLSGVTFVSVPGGVGSGNFYYFQIVLGYLIGYMVIAFVLIPLYYRMNLTSIYTYLGSDPVHRAREPSASRQPPRLGAWIQAWTADVTCADFSSAWAPRESVRIGR